MSPRSRAENDEAKRARIVGAARDVCSRRGFDAARMEEIAGEAQVSKGTLYRFFQSKEDLFLATVLDSYAHGRRIVRAQAPPAGGDPRERLAQCVRALVGSFPAIAGEMTVNFQAWGVVARDPNARERLFAALREIYAERSAELEEALRAGQDEGVFRRDVDPGTWIATLLAAFDGLLYRSTFDPPHANVARLEAACDALLGAIEAGGPGANGGGSRRG